MNVPPTTEDVRRLRIEEIRREIEAGARQIRQGQYKVYASADALMDDIEKRGKERLTAKQNGKN